jgi:hypothetical protein
VVQFIFVYLGLGLLVPPSIFYLEFKTKEELELMPQTEEEYIHDLVRSLHP